MPSHRMPVFVSVAATDSSTDSEASKGALSTGACRLDQPEVERERARLSPRLDRCSGNGIPAPSGRQAFRAGLGKRYHSMRGLMTPSLYSAIISKASCPRSR